MRNSRAVALLFAVFGYTSVAKAQGTPALELYSGYDYVRYNANPKISGIPPSESFNANGVSGQIAYNPNNWLGLAAELSGYALARQGFATTYQISYLFGPKINVRRGKITPFFARGLHCQPKSGERTQGCHCSSSAWASQNHLIQIAQRTVAGNPQPTLPDETAWHGRSLFSSSREVSSIGAAPSSRHSTRAVQETATS